MTADLLTSYEDKTIEGAYRLGRLVEASSESAIYQTEYGDHDEPALIELQRGDSPDSERTLSEWRDALELSHPHLIHLYAAGNSTLDGVPVIYRVTQRADESLAEVLAERALTEQETREMLEPTLSALGYLHKNGYAHGSLRPANVLALQDTLKLSNRTVTRANLREEDMHALGSLLVQALRREDPSEPMRGIIQHCLDADPSNRWTAEQALAHLHPPSRPTPMQEISLPATADHRKLIFGISAALLVLVVAFFITRKTETASAPPVTVQEATATAPQTEPTQPSARVTAPLPVSVAKTISPTHDRRASGWIVVVASYGARAAAEKRAREMTSKFTGFNVGVFEPLSEKTRYLVVLGTDLSEDKADSLRKRALASGLPRDTYIKRLGAR